jgi:hypothetical protein
MWPRQSTDECADEWAAYQRTQTQSEEHQAEARGKLIGSAFDNQVSKNQVASNTVGYQTITVASRVRSFSVELKCSNASARQRNAARVPFLADFVL